MEESPVAPLEGPLGVVLVDSRRLTGPSLYGDEPGAVVELRFGPDCEPERVVARWLGAVAWGARELGWPEDGALARGFADPATGERGAELRIAAPVDQLYAATELNEWAVAFASGEAEHYEVGSLASLARSAASEREARAGALALIAEAEARAVPWLIDDESLSLAYFDRCQSWSVSALPAPQRVDWDALAGPERGVALITGTNGKTTTTRMLARIARRAGRRAGNTSTDGLFIDEALVEAGDWTGPGGARAVLRDTSIELALLEAARGGLLRRGAGVRRCAVAVITNVAADHLGEYGVYGLDAMAAAKGIIARLATHRVVLGVDSEALAAWLQRPLRFALGPKLGATLVCFSLNTQHPLLQRARAAGEECWSVVEGVLTRFEGERSVALCALDSIPASLGGAALHNVQNALAAAAGARGLGFADAAIVAGLQDFGRAAQDNPGRTRLERLALREGGELELLLDFAHNLAGIEAIAALARRRARPVSLCFGMAGDRSDAELVALGRALAALEPCRVILREQPSYLRGRALGEVPARLAEGLRAGGYGGQCPIVGSEVESLERALAAAKAGDLLILLAHVERDQVEAWLRSRARVGDTDPS